MLNSFFNHKWKFWLLYSDVFRIWEASGTLLKILHSNLTNQSAIYRFYKTMARNGITSVFVSFHHHCLKSPKEFYITPELWEALLHNVCISERLCFTMCEEDIVSNFKILSLINVWKPKSHLSTNIHNYHLLFNY